MIPRQSLFDPTPATAITPDPPPATVRPIPDDAPAHASRRTDGWSAATQRRFLEAIAEGAGVEAACRHVGLSATSAYAFRRTAKGAAFALGWRAAALVAREAIAETLLVRALEGQVDTYVRADGSIVTRHRHDNRLAMSLLARLDRQHEAAPDADSKAARLVAQEFDAYLDLLARDEGPARAGLFLARRAGGLLGGALTDDSENPSDLAPIYALAAADRLARTGVATAAEVPVADLDPLARADWTAEQWQRAEAAGLLRLAVPAAQTAPDPQLPQHSDDDCDDALELEDDDSPLGDDPFVWWDEDVAEWRTRFPAPPGEIVLYERGEPDELDYARSLTDAEAEAIGPGPDRLEPGALAALARGRPLYFATAARVRAEHRAAHPLPQDLYETERIAAGATSH